MPRATGVVLLLCGCFSKPAAPSVVARAGDVSVTVDDLRFAAAGAAPDHARIATLIDQIVVDEQLARDARAIPGAEARAQAAARRATITEMINMEVEAGAVRAYWDAGAVERRVPASVELAHVVVACDQVVPLARRLQGRELSFEAAALAHSLDRATATRGGELGTRTEAQLTRTEQQAIARLPVGAISRPFRDGESCRVLKLLARHAAQTLPPTDAAIAARVRAGREAAARAQLVHDEGGPSADDRRRAAAELSALAPPVAVGGLDAQRARLAEEMLLLRVARRRGLGNETARAAERASLADEARARATADETPERVPADAVRDAYQRNRGDYTEPRQVRAAALVTRDREKADRWRAELRKARFPGTRFGELVAESEAVDARATHGDLGWLSGRSNAPDALKLAVLALARPGEISGPIPSLGVYYVLACTDMMPERVLPLVEVEPKIRDTLADARRRAALEALEAAARARAPITIDWRVVDEREWTRPPPMRSR
jgi:parvulin-like peptidyl-prolyl isomerase